jgi:hypothetical protein
MVSAGKRSGTPSPLIARQREQTSRSIAAATIIAGLVEDGGAEDRIGRAAWLILSRKAKVVRSDFGSSSCRMRQRNSS